MGLEISQIKNAELIKAAMQADQETESATAKNGVLDETELSLFVQKAGNAVTQDETAMEEFTEILGLVKTQQKTPVSEKTETKIERQETHSSYPANTEHVSMETILEVLRAKGVNLSQNEKEQLEGMFGQADTHNYTRKGYTNPDNLLTINKGEFDNFLNLVKNSNMTKVADALQVDNTQRTKYYFNEIEKNKHQIDGKSSLGSKLLKSTAHGFLGGCLSAFFGFTASIMANHTGKSFIEDLFKECNKRGQLIAKVTPALSILVGLGVAATIFTCMSKQDAESDTAKSRLEQLKNEF